jgi:hypothetical protein
VLVSRPKYKHKTRGTRLGRVETSCDSVEVGCVSRNRIAFKLSRSAICICIRLFFALPVIRSQTSLSGRWVCCMIDSRYSQRCTMRCHAHTVAEFVLQSKFSSSCMNLDCFLDRIQDAQRWSFETCGSVECLEPDITSTACSVAVSPTTCGCGAKSRSRVARSVKAFHICMAVWIPSWVNGYVCRVSRQLGGPVMEHSKPRLAKRCFEQRFPTG